MQRISILKMIIIIFPGSCKCGQNEMKKITCNLISCINKIIQPGNVTAREVS